MLGYFVEENQCGLVILMSGRNRYIARQLRAALRRSRWDAGTIARRAFISRELMARILFGDETISLGEYELVAEQLELNLMFIPWAEPCQLSAPVDHVESVVDVALRRGTVTELAGMFTPPPGAPAVSIEDMRVENCERRAE